MPKRYYTDIDDGAPGEDDARYASATYNTVTALPGAQQHAQAQSSGSPSHVHQQQHPIQVQAPAPIHGTVQGSSSGNNSGNIGFDASQFAHVGYSVTPPLSIPVIPTIPPVSATGNTTNGDGVPAAISATSNQSPSTSAVQGSGSSPAVAPPVASGSNATGSASATGSQRQAHVPRRRILPPDAPAHSIMEEDEETFTYTLTPELRATMFREVHGRQLNTMQTIYQLPADEDEIKRQEYFHKMMYIVMGDRIWVGPLEDVLSVPSDRKRRVLDIGCGSGIWAIQVADEFPDVEVVGCDLAPVQPDLVPPNCDFELFDAQLNPYPDEYFDVVHARGVHTGIRNYPLFLEEIARILAPGGLVILAESEIRALTEGKTPIDAGPRGGAPGWHAFWEQYRRCLQGNHIDTTVPTRLGALLRATGAFEEIVAQEATLPVGFWPKDENMLAVGEHAWMDHDRFVPGVRPLFLNYGLSEFRVKILVEDAQQDLYYPLTRPYTCVHVSHARKLVSWQAPRRRSRRLR